MWTLLESMLLPLPPKKLRPAIRVVPSEEELLTENARSDAPSTAPLITVESGPAEDSIDIDFDNCQSCIG
jgi:hypothetical protein